MSRRRRRREPGIIREILGWIFYIIVILVLTYVIITYVGQRTSVSGSSMETTLSDGDQLLVDKLSYRFQNPKRFDIIVFPYQYEENTYYIKRIIGLPGETVQVVDGYVYINGSRLESDIYGNELMDDPMAASQPITLGEDEYFVLGDNRNHSQDSRDPSVGEVKKDTIMGKAYKDYPYICGIDEVGRGPLAGPVVAGAVILPKDDMILYLNDSKKLSEKKREMLYDEIMNRAVATGIGMASPARIDEINILQATYEAMRMAIDNLKVRPDILLNDAVTIPQVDILQVPIIKGDAKSISIAAASIIAKVTRDRLMVEYDKVLPGYDFASNKGYGTKAHIAGLKELGPTPIHRRSFIHNYV